MYRSSGRFLFNSIFLLLSVLCISSGYPQEVLLPQDEEPSSFLEILAGDPAVDLFLSGSWKIDLSAGTGFSWTADKGFNPDLGYSALDTGISFKQQPDFTAVLSIMERYYLEAAFADTFEKSGFAAGYRGKEGELLQSVRIGNNGINLSDEMNGGLYFYIPGGGYSSLGIISGLETASSSHELLLRFDPEKQQKKVYVGKNLVTETVLQPSDYINGRFFIIQAGLDDPPVFVECPENKSTATLSAGVYIRQLDEDEYSYNPSDGSLYLAEKPAGIAAVGAGGVDGGKALDNPFVSGLISDYIISSGAGSLLVICGDGFSPFETAAYYAAGAALPSEIWKTRVYLADSPSSLDSAIELNAEIRPSAGIIKLKPFSGSSPHYPLSSLQTSPSIYGPEAEKGEGVFRYSIVIQTREKEEYYSAEKPVKGSVRVYINGIETKDWTVDESGRIEFASAPGENDRIEIVYRRENSGDEGGDILFASSNSFSLGCGLTASLKTGLRWNAFGNGPVSEPDGSPGSIFGEAALEWKPETSEGIKAGISAGFSLSNLNTTGLLILRNSQDSGLSVNTAPGSILPGPPSLLINGGLDSVSRGRLIYKDYRRASSADNWSLLDYDAQLPAELIQDPASSPAASPFKAGPYAAGASKDGITKPVAVMDYVLPETGSWTSFIIPLDADGGDSDLSVYEALSFMCRTESDPDGIELYVEIGAVSEDLDADGILDGEPSAHSSGWLFNDPNAPGGTLVGGDNLFGSNNVKDSEDINSNGFSDRENSDLIALFSAGTASPDFTLPSVSWKTVRLDFSAAPSSGSLKSRFRLRQTRAIRITAVNKSGAPRSGRLMFTGFEFEGSSFFDGRPGPDSFASISETSIPTEEKPDEALILPYSVENNKVMRIAWSDRWRLFSPVAATAPGDYKKLVMYLHTLSSSGAVPLKLRLTDSADRGLEAGFTLSAARSAGWEKIVMDTESGQVLADGVPVEGASVVLDKNSGRLTRLELLMEDGAGTGIIYIDEIRFEGSAFVPSAGISAYASYESSGPLLEAGGLEIIGKLKAEQRFKAGLPADGSSFAEIDSLSRLSSVLLGADIAAEAGYILSGGSGRLSASHSLGIPIAGSALRLSDRFRTSDVNGGDFTRSAGIDADAGFISGKLAGFTASSVSGRLVQEWKSDFKLSAGPFSMQTSAALSSAGSGYMPDWTGYFTGWTQSLLLAAGPEALPLVQRITEAGIAPSVSAGFTGLDLSVKFKADTTPGKTGNSYLLGLSVPIRIDTSAGITAKLGYDRKALLESAESAGFKTDAEGLFSRFAGQRSLIYSVPAYEFFDAGLPAQFISDCNAAGITGGSLENILKLVMERSYGSSLLDLFLPYSVSIEVSRKILNDYGIPEDRLGLSLSSRTSALNLFGTAGTNRLFDFYFTDDFSYSVGALIEAAAGKPVVQEYKFLTELGFTGNSEQSLGITADIVVPVGKDDAAVSGKGKALFSWNTYPEKPLDLPLFTGEEEMLQMFVHEEKLETRLASTAAVEASHKSSLVIPQTLTLSVFVSAGVEYDPGDGNPLFMFGAKAGISGNIFY